MSDCIKTGVGKRNGCISFLLFRLVGGMGILPVINIFGQAVLTLAKMRKISASPPLKHPTPDR
ncbi:MAG: hypothetical protein F6K65_27765 [Moorea sp. SIO3C2]|nr:hypothetical protein [Moorena sp. SIO3C2]